MTAWQLEALRSKVADLRADAEHCRKMAAKHNVKAHAEQGTPGGVAESTITTMYRMQADDLESHARSIEGLLDVIEETERENAHDDSVSVGA